jgi:hypothetical protein
VNIESLDINGSEVDMPAYMHHLAQDEINNIVQEEDRSTRIVAAGVHQDGSVLFVTGLPEVWIFNPEEYHIPPGLYVPSTDGITVKLPSNSQRWPGVENGFTVESTWLISRSEPALRNAQLSAGDNYLGEINLESVKVDHS